MKTLFLIAIAGICVTTAFAQQNLFPTSGQVGIGTTIPDSSAILEIRSTKQGVLIPSMTIAQRDSINLPATGLLIFQTDSFPGFYYYNGVLWSQVKTMDANTALSNLQSTAINVSLLPSTDNVLTLGALSKKWNTIYTKGINIDGDIFLSNGIFRDSANTFVGATHNTTTTGGRNVFAGNDAGRVNTTGNSNTFVGYAAGKANTVGSFNCFYGMNAGLSNTSGFQNTFLGYGAGQANTNGANNTFVGYKSGIKNTTGGTNTFCGDLSGNNNLTGSQNVFVGASSGTGSTGSNNTLIGYSAGTAITTGENNTFIGSVVNATSSSISNSIVIGNNCSVDQSNVIRLGNFNITKIGIGRNPASTDIMDFQGTSAKLTTGGVWTNASDRKLKNNFQDLDAGDILDKIDQLHIQRWHYLADRESTTHIGPVAQDFHQLFGVGDDTTISTIDPSGVALLAIQALSAKDKQRDAAITEQRAQITELRTMIADIQQSLSQCCMSYKNSNSQEQSTNDEDAARLEQNVPNPFSSNTTIKCYLPSTAKSATIIISSVDGKELKSFPLSNPGINEININGGTLPVGEYLYSLLIDGKKIDTRKMVLTQ